MRSTQKISQVQRQPLIPKRVDMKPLWLKVFFYERMIVLKGAFKFVYEYVSQNIDCF